MRTEITFDVVENRARHAAKTITKQMAKNAIQYSIMEPKMQRAQRKTTDHKHSKNKQTQR